MPPAPLGALSPADRRPMGTTVDIATQPGLVSILATVKNAARWLPGYLECVLGQTYADLEVVVCDNGSTDGSVELLEQAAASDSRVRFFRNEADLGIGGSIERAYGFARGEFAKMVMADDRIVPHALERLVASLRDAPSLVFATSARSRVDEHDRGLEPWPEMRPLVAADSVVPGRALGDHVLRTCLNWVGEPLFRTAGVPRVGLFSIGRRRYRSTEDVAFTQKLLAAGDVSYLVEPLSLFRSRPDQEGATLRRQVTTTAAWYHLIDDGRRLGFLRGPDAERAALVTFLDRAVVTYASARGQVDAGAVLDPSDLAELAEALAAGASSLALLETVAAEVATRQGRAA